MERLEESALAALPIFPLPDVVLFPGALLPLHVFEPRYRELTADVLAGARVMGIARLRPGYQADYEGRPPVFSTFGAGYVVASEKLPDGRYHLMLRGVARATIQVELPPARSYREVRAQVLSDTRSARAAALPALHAEVIALCDQLSLHMTEDGKKLRELARALPSPGGCADALSAALVLDPDERQRQLETMDPADRLEAVKTHVALLLTRMASSSGPVN
jgi:Lon protease-like protein